MNYNIKRGLGLFVGLVVSIIFNAQPNSLKLNAPFPDIKIENVINHTSPTIRMSDFKGKAVIFIFWHTGCYSCVKHFAKWDSIQRQFGDKLQIIMVNPNGRDSTVNFFAIRKKLKKPSIPFVTGDSFLLRSFFPEHRFKTIWINPSGVISAVTPELEVYPDKIVKFISGKKVNFAPILDKQYVNSLFDDHLEDQVGYYSYISKAIPGVKLNYNSNPDVTMILPAGRPRMIDLYREAFGEAGMHDFGNALRLDVRMSNQSLLNERFFYHLSLPGKRNKERYQIMRQDLDRYFNLDAYIEQRKINGIAFLRTSSNDKLKTKGGKPLSTLAPSYTNTDTIAYLTNIPFSGFSSTLKSYIERTLKIPMVDETGYVGDIDIWIPQRAIETMSLDELNVELARYDLRLIKKEVTIEFLVIKDK